MPSAVATALCAVSRTPCVWARVVTPHRGVATTFMRCLIEIFYYDQPVIVNDAPNISGVNIAWRFNAGLRVCAGSN